MKTVRLEAVKQETSALNVSLQPASRDIWDKKYRLKTKDGQPIDDSIDATYQRVARALAEVEATPELRELWYEKFLHALRQGAIPAGRIISNAGAWEHKPATSTINCTVSGTIQDSMDDILRKVHEAGLTLKAGCVAPGTWVYTEQGLVTADQAVAEKHTHILSYDREQKRFELRRIQRHLTTRVSKEENIEIISNRVSLKTSVKHPVLVYRNGALCYVRADDVCHGDALVQHRFAWTADETSAMTAWFVGAHLGDGCAYEKRMSYKAARPSWAARARACGKRLIFKIRAAEREVVERYAEFFRSFCGAQAKVVAAATFNGTRVWDYTVASFEASRAAELIDYQTGKKSETLSVPGWIVQQPDKYFLPFLAGLIDTDGTANSEQGNATISMRNPAFGVQLKALLGLFGVSASLNSRKPRTHLYNGHLIRDSGGAMLKISDSAFLARVASYMADSGKKRRILEHASQAGQYDRYVMPQCLRAELAAQFNRVSHKERLHLGFYHRYHEKPIISRVFLDRWAKRFPALTPLIEFAMTLRPVEDIRRHLDLPETFFDFTVEEHNNYLAGNAGLVVIHNCGIGYEFSTLRPRGAYVSGAGAYTSGPLSFMDIYDKMCFTVSSAGGRRGAQMATFDIGHPDVLEFIKAKREDGRLRQFNLSLLITEDFMRAVHDDVDWPLAFPLREQEVAEDGIDLADPKKVIWRDWPIKAGLIVNAQGQIACKIYKTIRARRLWDLIMSSTYDYAEPGFILIDKVNEMNNNWWCENIRATNPCVTADTRLHTQYGLIPIGELYASGVPLEVTVDNRAMQKEERGTTVRPALPAFLTAHEADVYRVVTAAGYEIKATEWHDFYTTHGKIKLKDLKPGDELLVQCGKGQFGSQGSAELGQLIGLITGDGHITHRGNGQEAAVINSWGLDCALADGLANSINRLIESLSQTGRAYRIRPVAIPGRHLIMLRSVLLARMLEHYGFTAKTKHRVPEVVWRGTEGCVKGYLRGLFQTDGTVNVSSTSQSCSIRLASSHSSLLKDVQMLLANLGIFCRIHKRREASARLLPDGKGGHKAYNCKADYELIIEGESRERFMAEVGFLGEAKNARYREWVKDRVLRKSQSFTARIAEIVYVGQEAVFDTTQADHNTVIFNGLVTGQCGEQPLPPYGSCWTGAMRLNTNYGLIRTDEAFDLVQQGKPLLVGVDDVFSQNKTDLRPCTLVRNGEKEVFEVRFANGQRIELTADHRVYTPEGWKEVRALVAGSEVHVQARELAHLDLVPRFDLGALKYVLERYDGEHLVITRASQRAFVRPLLDRLCVNYREGAKGLFVSRHHALVREVERVDLATADLDVVRGYLYAAQATAARYKGRPAVYGERGFVQSLADAIVRVTGRQQAITHHGRDSYRLLLPQLDWVAPADRRTLDLDFALYGWLLADGWLTDSAGVLFSDQDDQAMALLAPRFASMTGTSGSLRKAYTGQQRDVYSLACYRKDAVQQLRKYLGLADYTSRSIRVPERIFSADSAKQASFLAAVFCADGGINADKLCIHLTSASEAFLQDVQLLLLNFGIHSSIRAQISRGNAFYSLRLSQADAYRYWRFIGFPFNTSKQESLERLLRDKQRWREPTDNAIESVVSICSLGVQPVYDIEEFSTHTLIVNGVVVHNCLLGSVNLTKFVRNPFTDRARFDWDAYREVVAIFTRMLDNVVEINGLPLEQQRREILSKRRHGMGYLGLGSTLTLLRMKYGSPESLEFTERVTKEMALAGWRVALELAKEKGPAPLMEQEFTITQEMLSHCPELHRDGFNIGDKLKGKVLHARYSRYMQRIAEADPELVEELAEVGARFTHHSSIAPTGTISLSLANNASNGIEPSFAHHYARNVIREGRKTKEKIDVFSFELLAYRTLINPRAMPRSDHPNERLPEYFVIADDITPKEHVDIQAAAQKWIDSSISKTANVPTDFPYEDFKDIYRYAYEQGLKGCTTFRFNPEAFQGVLVKEQDLENTLYNFTLQDGSEITVKGNEQIEYDGEVHTAANLFDALKEGYYGKL